MEVPYLIVVVMLDIPAPRKTSKLKHWYRCCTRRASCIPWQQVIDILAKLASIARFIMELANVQDLVDRL